SVVVRPTSRRSYFVSDRTAPTEISTLSLHDALPICLRVYPLLPVHPFFEKAVMQVLSILFRIYAQEHPEAWTSKRCHRRDFANLDRKSTRLNSSHVKISYAVFCLKKKKPHATRTTQ